MKLDLPGPAVMSPVLGRLHLVDVPEVEAVEGILGVPLEPHDEGHGPARAGGCVAGERHTPANVAKHLHHGA